MCTFQSKSPENSWGVQARVTDCFLSPSAGVGEPCIQRVQLRNHQPTSSDEKWARRHPAEQRETKLHGEGGETERPLLPRAAGPGQLTFALPGRRLRQQQQRPDRTHLHPHCDLVGRRSVWGGRHVPKLRLCSQRGPRQRKIWVLWSGHGRAGRLWFRRSWAWITAAASAPSRSSRFSGGQSCPISHPVIWRREGVAGLPHFKRTVRRRLPSRGLGHHWQWLWRIQQPWSLTGSTADIFPSWTNKLPLKLRQTVDGVKNCSGRTNRAQRYFRLNICEGKTHLHL